jgi:hypothetical protein
MHEITLDHFIRLRSKYALILDLEGFFIFLGFVLSDDIFGYDSVIYDHIVELAGIDISFYRIDKVYDFHIGRLATFGHRVTDIYDFCTCIVEGFTHTFREEIGYYARIEISGADDDIVSLEDSFMSEGIQVSFVTFEPGIDDILIDIMYTYKVIFI